MSFEAVVEACDHEHGTVEKDALAGTFCIHIGTDRTVWRNMFFQPNSVIMVTPARNGVDEECRYIEQVIHEEGQATFVANAVAVKRHVSFGFIVVASIEDKS